MPSNSLFDSNIVLLKKVLDLRSEKQRVIASNIANAETPGYAATRFEFEDDLREAMKTNRGDLLTTHQHHIPAGTTNITDVQGRTTQIEDNTGIGDENGVSVDQEMVALSENELLYEAAAQLLKKKMALIKYVVQGGQ